MKKIITAILTGTILVSSLCGFTYSNEKEIKKITWEHGGELPAQKGYKKNIGTAGILSGKIDNFIIAGGGANFPEESVLNGGAKKTYPDIYLLKKDSGNKLSVVDHIQLPFEIGYGSSVTTKNGVYYIGGSTNSEYANDITLFTQKDGKIKYEKIADLPFTISDGIAVEHNGKLYIGFGKQNGKSSNKFISFDLKTKSIKDLTTLNDGSTRNQAVAQVLNGNIYLFSGGGDIIFTDGYKYDIAKNDWSSIGAVKVNNKEISLYGGNSVKLNEKEMLVIGGFDKTVYDNAVKNLNTLKGEGLQKFRNSYFSADPYEFNWNKQVLVYNAEKNSWRTLGEITFDAPCGEGLVLFDNTIISINGEIKPGVRANKIYVGNLFN